MASTGRQPNPVAGGISEIEVERIGVPRREQGESVGMRDLVGEISKDARLDGEADTWSSTASDPSISSPAAQKASVPVVEKSRLLRRTSSKKRCTGTGGIVQGRDESDQRQRCRRHVSPSPPAKAGSTLRGSQSSDAVNRGLAAAAPQSVSGWRCLSRPRLDGGQRGTGPTGSEGVGTGPPAFMAQPTRGPVRLALPGDEVDAAGWLG